MMNEVDGRRREREPAGEARTRPQWRDITGVVILDKRSGVTSNTALQEVRRLFSARKAGHTGSLDPLATGVLPICLGEATKLSGLLLDAAKVYEVTGRLGTSTDTGDCSGVETGQAGWSDIDARRVQEALANFTGMIEQVPPMYSALKHKGERLYKIARSGKTVARSPRTITIHNLELLNFTGPDFTLRVACSKGTYIRTLVEDIAESMGSRAHVVALRRLAAGPFDIDAAVSIEQLQDAAAGEQDAIECYRLDADSAVSGYPKMRFSDEESRRLLQGQRIRIEESAGDGQLVRLYGADSCFLGMGEIQPGGLIAPKRLFKRAG